MTDTHFHDWLLRYGGAWEQGDPEAAVALFSPSAVYFETPFDEPMAGTEAIRRYWTEGAKDGQTVVRFEASVISFDGKTGFAHWTACFRRVGSGTFVELEGVLRAEFDDLGRCVTFREWWHRRER